MADFFNAVRHTQVFSKLGAAFLSSISDVGFNIITRKFNGLPVMGMISGLMRQMNPASDVDRLFAVKLGLTADAWINRALAANRFTEVTGAGWAARISDSTMRASLLSPWTDAGRKGFGIEFMGALADHIELDFNAFRKASPTLAGTLERYGIGAKEWDVIRTTKPVKFKGAKFVSQENIMARTDLDEAVKREVTNKTLEMVLTETDFAVPTPDARSRAISTGGGLQRGTIAGELARSFFLFKSFPITVVTTHMMRGALAHGLKGKASYLMQLSITTTVLGAIALQMKEISRGKDPRPMDDSRFWAAAFTQGGGAGIWGDFLFSDVNRFGRGIVRTALGPVPDLFEDLTKFTLGNIQQLLQGKETNVGREAVSLLRQYTPGGSIWYTRLAFERLFIDHLDELADAGKARKARARMLRFRRREFGQEYFWRPGELTPDRPPSFEDIGG